MKTVRKYDAVPTRCEGCGSKTGFGRVKRTVPSCSACSTPPVVEAPQPQVIDAAKAPPPVFHPVMFGRRVKR